MYTRPPPFFYFFFLSSFADRVLLTVSCLVDPPPFLCLIMYFLMFLPFLFMDDRCILSRASSSISGLCLSFPFVFFSSLLCLSHCIRHCFSVCLFCSCDCRGFERASISSFVTTVLFVFLWSRNVSDLWPGALTLDEGPDVKTIMKNKILVVRSGNKIFTSEVVHQVKGCSVFKTDPELKAFWNVSTLSAWYYYWHGSL